MDIASVEEEVATRLRLECNLHNHYGCSCSPEELLVRAFTAAEERIAELEGELITQAIWMADLRREVEFNYKRYEDEVDARKRATRR